jgi:hypothetical protein
MSDSHGSATINGASGRVMNGSRAANNGNASYNGLTQAGEALVSDMAAAVTRGEPGTDPLVPVAFALGWQMAELYQPQAWPTNPPVRGACLPGVSKMQAPERAFLGLSQVDVALSRLHGALSEHGLNPPTTEKARGVLESHAVPTDNMFRDAIFDLHLRLLAVLTATDFKLGKAYGLGRALAEATGAPGSLEEVRRRLRPRHVAKFRAHLSDLATALPAHAAESVSQSLSKWSDWAAPAQPVRNESEDDEHVRLLLRRQGQRWRSLLSDEKHGTDALELQNYVEAGAEALKRTSRLTLKFLLRFFLLLIVIALLFAGGVALILVDNSAAHIAAGLGGILASLGLTWKGIGGSLGATAGKLERPVWEASLDLQIAQAITIVPGGVRAKGYVPPGAARKAAGGVGLPAGAR